MTFEEAIRKFSSSLREALERAFSEPEAVAQAFRGVDMTAVISDALKSSGLRLAQMETKRSGTIEGDHRS